MIREITETTGAKVDIDDDGTIKVSAVDAKAAQAAIDWIRGIVAEPELGVDLSRQGRQGRRFRRLRELPRLARRARPYQRAGARSASARSSDVVKVGDQVKVKVLGFDDRGKVKLSMRQVDQQTGEDLSKRAEAE